MILEAKDLPTGAIRGETTDKEMSDKKAIEITKFTLSGRFEDTDLDESPQKESAPRSPVSDKLELSVSKNLDRSSPALMLAYCYQQYDTNAKAFPKLTIIVRKAGDIDDDGKAQTPYMEFVFKDVRLTSYNCGGSHDSNVDMPTEDLTFRFKSFSMQYWRQLATGRTEPMKETAWNFFGKSQ